MSSTLSWFLLHLIPASGFLPLFPLSMDCDTEVLYPKLLLVMVLYDSNRNHKKISKTAYYQKAKAGEEDPGFQACLYL